ncbi:MAG: MAPEG family protein [Reyranellaceae bacterium]
MTSELMMLALSGALCLVLALPYTMGLVLKLGLPVMAGNRESFPAVEGWIGRARRAHLNLVENLVPFAALVLAAAALSKLGPLTALGAQLFFWGRVAHAVAYIAGIAYARTAAYLVAVVGMALIFIAIVR